MQKRGSIIGVILIITGIFLAPVGVGIFLIIIGILMNRGGNWN